MTKTNHIQFDRNQDIYTNYYYIYRSTNSNVSIRSQRIMKIQQVMKPNPILTMDTPKRLDARTYQLSHRSLFLDRGYSLFINGLYIEEHYRIEDKEGLLIFDEDQAKDASIQVEYYFDGIEVVDNIYVNDPEQVTYYGPPAVDNVPASPPSNTSMTLNADGTITLHYQVTPNIGQDFYYTIEARSNAGDYSLLSPVIHAYLKEEIAGVMIESTLDSQSWTRIGETKEASYVDTHADVEPPEALVNASYTVNGSSITFGWSTPLLNDKIGLTPKYRIRTKLANGVLSQPSSIVGPESVKTPIDKIVIKRKAYNGSYPAYNDPTAATVAEITDVTKGNYTVPGVLGNNDAYSLFVVDKAGNYSSAATFTIAL